MNDRKVKFQQIACNQRGADDETLYGLDEDGAVWEYRFKIGESRWIPLLMNKEG